MSSIRLRKVSKAYGEALAVDHIDLTVPQSSLTVLLGSSGCGKTTTLRLIAGLERPDSGDIWLGEQQVSGGQVWLSATQRRIGMVFQDYALFPHMTVAENVAFGLNGRADATRDGRIGDMLDLAGLMGMEERFPHQLSGGQQQRVALARALAPSPNVILLDEPFSNLDASLRQSMREDVRRILGEAGVTTVFVTHDQEEALRLADQLVVMDGGHILQTGPPESVYRYPADLRVARFLAEINVLDGEARQGGVETVLGRLPLHNPSISGPVDVVLFPETISLSPDSESNVVVERATYFGFHQLVTLRLPTGEALQARTWSHATYSPGDRVHVKVDSPVVAFAKQ